MGLVLPPDPAYTRASDAVAQVTYDLNLGDPPSTRAPGRAALREQKGNVAQAENEARLDVRVPQACRAPEADGGATIVAVAGS